MSRITKTEEKMRDEEDMLDTFAVIFTGVLILGLFTILYEILP